MTQVAYCLALTFLFMVNSVNSTTPVLGVINFVVGLYFAVISVVAGWVHARRD